MEKYIKILSECPLFKGISEQEIQKILSCLNASAQEYQKQQIILMQGTKPQKVGILLSGGLLLTREEYDGTRNIVTQVYPGEIFAESFAFAPEEQRILPVAVEASTDSAVLWLDARQIFKTCALVCTVHTKVIENMLGVMAQKNVLLNRKIGHLCKRTTREKVLSYLSEQALLQKSSTITIPFSHQELSDYLCVERSGLSSALANLRREGIIKYNRKTFKLCFMDE